MVPAWSYPENIEAASVSFQNFEKIRIPHFRAESYLCRDMIGTEKSEDKSKDVPRCSEEYRLFVI